MGGGEGVAATACHRAQRARGVRSGAATTGADSRTGLPVLPVAAGDPCVPVAQLPVRLHFLHRAGAAQPATCPEHAERDANHPGPTASLLITQCSVCNRVERYKRLDAIE